MKFSEFEKKSLTDLIKQKGELTSRLFDMKMKNTLGQLATPHQITSVRRDIAKINTAIVRKAAR